MRSYITPHEVTDPAKVAQMVAILTAGGTLPPVVVLDNDCALTGTHRLAAYAQADVEPEVVVVAQSDYVATCEVLGIEHHTEAADVTEFCRALRRITTDRALRAALRDQIV